MPERIVIIGNSATGKTTLAREITARLQCPHIERDALQWGAGWTAVSDDVFRARVAEAVEGDRWVADGNFSRVREVVWGRADTLLWLDYPLVLILWRLTRRSWARIRTQKVMWNGNRETWGHLLGRNGVFAWTLKAHSRHHLEYPALLELPQYQHLTVVRLRTPGATQKWINTLLQTSPNEDNANKKQG